MDKVINFTIILLLLVGAILGIITEVPTEAPHKEMSEMKYIGWESDENALIPRIPEGY